MKNILVKKTDLIELVQKNKKTHLEQYELAIEGYWKTMAEKADELREKAAARAKPVNVVINIFKPQNHLEEYETALKMLEMHQSGTIEISKEEFEKYALDKWSWKREWALSNSTYLGKDPNEDDGQ